MKDGSETPFATAEGRRIMVDGMSYVVKAEALSGTELRRLAHPPIGEDRDLYVERPGGTDELVGANDEIGIAEGIRLFSAPRNIAAGHLRAP